MRKRTFYFIETALILIAGVFFFIGGRLFKIWKDSLK